MPSKVTRPHTTNGAPSAGGERWRATVGLTNEELPDVVILEGSWWQKERNHQRLAQLSSVRETNLPEIHWGRYGSLNVIYSCIYGAPRAIEPIHIFGSICRPLIIQIGSCGSLSEKLHTGDILIPTSARVGEGASQWYANDDCPRPTARLVEAATRLLGEHGHSSYCGPSITTSALFAQPRERVAGWHAEGYLGVDMETSAVFTVAHHFGLPALSLLFAWDELLANRSFLDKFGPEEEARQTRANEIIYEVALALAAEEQAGQ